jgi:hypothetical protein
LIRSAVSIALASGVTLTENAVAGLPLKLTEKKYSLAPSSTRATSRMRTVEPSGSARRMMAPNSSTVSSCPRTCTLYWNCWFFGTGNAPICPAGACWFCSLIAWKTSVGEMPRRDMRSGLSHTRMPNSAPNTCTLPTPLTRLIASTTLTAR